MSAASHATKLIPYNFSLSATLPTNEQQTIKDLLSLLLANFSDRNSTITIKKLVDGRNLACPMPLLKTKVALREIAEGEALYVIATDPNSQADITAFCQQSQTSSANSLELLVNTMTINDTTDDAANENAITISKNHHAVDTIFHFIITKTDSN